MKDLAGKIAFITGAASGIGLGLAQAFAAAGMRVAITDVEKGALDKAEAGLRDAGADVWSTVLDVTDRAAFARAADAAEAHFGKVHVICNNAGVTSRGPIERASYDDWDWVLGVNLGGVINGVHVFLPRIKAHGEGGHIVNTSSIAGLIAGPGNGVYNTSKYAVVGLSETLRAELAPDGIGVTVLCPGSVRTGINDADRNRPKDLADAGNVLTPKQKDLIVRSFEHGTEPREFGDMVVDAVRADRLYVLPHAEHKARVKARFDAIMADFTADPPDPIRVADDKYRNEGFAMFFGKKD